MMSWLSTYWLTGGYLMLAIGVLLGLIALGVALFRSWKWVARLALASAICLALSISICGAAVFVLRSSPTFFVPRAPGVDPSVLARVSQQLMGVCYQAMTAALGAGLVVLLPWWLARRRLRAVRGGVFNAAARSG